MPCGEGGVSRELDQDAHRARVHNSMKIQRNSCAPTPQGEISKCHQGEGSSGGAQPAPDPPDPIALCDPPPCPRSLFYQGSPTPNAPQIHRCPQRGSLHGHMGADRGIWSATALLCVARPVWTRGSDLMRSHRAPLTPSSENLVARLPIGESVPVRAAPLGGIPRTRSISWRHQSWGGCLSLHAQDIKREGF